MPLSIKKKNGKYCVVDPAGKQFGCHPSKKGAVDQIAAIEINKAKSGIELLAEDKVSKALEMGGYPPIMIMSDGSAKGTVLVVNGIIIPYKNIYLDCSIYDDPDIDNYCSMTIELEDVDANGLKIHRTLRLRKSGEN